MPPPPPKAVLYNRSGRGGNSPTDKNAPPGRAGGWNKNMSGFYCIFCRTGFEHRVETFLKKNGLAVVSSTVERNVIKHKKPRKEFRPLISGYVFFESDNEPDWMEFRQCEYIFYPLRYADNQAGLRGKDLEFVQWLKRRDGSIGISKAAQAGNRIKIIDGPLKEYEGKITKINKRQKCAEIEIGVETILKKVWLNYELVGIEVIE
jgi:transcriptional antiterminator NusG